MGVDDVRNMQLWKEQLKTSREQPLEQGGLLDRQGFAVIVMAAFIHSCSPRNR